MKRKRTHFRIISIIFIILIIAAVFECLELRFSHYDPAEYRESVEQLDNPYIGWCQIYRYLLSDTEPFDPAAIEEQEYAPGLVLLEINLQNYRETPLSEAALNQLDAILAAWQSGDKQLILRFLYDWDGSALKKEPKNISLILQHMSQTADIVNRYTDCVYILQGIFVGSWGEMHTSNYMSEEDMLTLAGHLNTVTDPSVFLAVRTPEQWRIITRSHEPLAPAQAFDGSLAARLSLFNDGMLGSDTDLGTYGTLEAFDYTQYYGKLTRQAEIQFQHTLCSYVPNGGEAVIDNPYNDFSAAVEYLADIHASYLNCGYDTNVLNKWKESIYAGGAPFDGMNGYDYITRHLGYRFVLRSSSLHDTSFWRQTALLSVDIENVGFSNSYRSFDVSLLLRNTEDNAEYLLPIRTDTRFWNAGEETRLDIPLELRAYATGSYELFLKISDPVSGFDICLANKAAQNADDFFLGFLELDKLPDF